MEPKPETSEEQRKEHPVMTAIEWIIFGFRFALAFLYLVTTLAAASYLVHACWETGAFAVNLWGEEQSGILVGVLTLLDDMMITSLLFLIIAGSFIVYVRRTLNDRVFKRESDRPPALSHLSPATLKTKMSGALVGVSAVLIIKILIQAFEVPADEMDTFIKRVIVIGSFHVVLVLSLMVFAWLSNKDNHGDAKSDTAKHDAAPVPATTIEHDGSPNHTPVSHSSAV